MIGDQKLLALITARSGSKRLPRKNILDLAGKPLIAWSIEAGLQSKYVDRVIVSTDDEEIARTCREYGADVPFMRPLELAHDSTPSIAVVTHALRSLEDTGETYKYLLLLQPTSPLRNSGHIDEAVEFLLEKKADSVVGVTEVEHPIELTNIIPENCSMDDFLSSAVEGKRSQDFPLRYRINGAIYLTKAKRTLDENSLLFRSNTFAFKMKRNASVDIDTIEDMNYAKYLAEQDPHQGQPN